MEKLRDYQQEMLYRLEEAWTEHRSVMVQMPTGTGKTLLLAQAIRNERQRAEGAGHVLIVAHRRELIEQIRRTVSRFMGDGSPLVTVESIQKLSRQDASLPGRHFSLIVIDEAHHAVARTYRRLWERWPEARFLGLTATPCRLGGEGFADLFEVLLQSWPIQEFIDRGYLSDFDYVSAAPDSEELRRVAGLDRRGADGDYQQKQMAAVLDCEESVAHLYDTYRQFAYGKKGIVYAISREHARHIATYYYNRGVRCAVIDSRTAAKEREELVERYRKTPPREGPGNAGGIDVLVNVDIFGEGFDVPEVEFIQLARPTLSLSRYLQQVGRGMRVSSGKDAVTILDNVGLYQLFGLPTDERDWRLMFYGRQSGRGSLNVGQQPMVVREEEREKTLVNLEMVRIKRRGERHEGVEVFVQDGKYGVMKDGVVTCRPEFAHIARLACGRYYAVATYPYAVFRGKSTVIGLSGQDLRVSLYGRVRSRGELMEGEDAGGRRIYWDGVGGHYFSSVPAFEEVGGVQMACVEGRYLPRHGAHLLKEPVERKDIWYNSDILWMGRLVIVKKTGRAYPIASYGAYCFYVKNGTGYQDGILKVRFDGHVVRMPSLDFRMEMRKEEMPEWGREQLIRASTGRLEYLDGNREKRRKQVMVY